MSYTMVRDEFSEIDRLNAQFDNIVKRHCKIGKVKTKAGWFTRQAIPFRQPLFTPGMAAPFNPPSTGTPDFIYNPVTSSCGTVCDDFDDWEVASGPAW